MQPGKTIVSITPTSLDADMRALKIARGFAARGYRSIVCEGLRSAQPDCLGVEVIGLTDLPNPASVQVPSPRSSRLRQWLRRGTGLPLVDKILAAGYRRSLVRRFGADVVGLIPDADLYYLHGFTYYPAVALKRRQRRVPLVYDAHDLYVTLGKTANRTKVAVPANPIDHVPFAIERDCVRAADAIVTVSDGVAEQLKALFNCLPLVVRNAHDRRLEDNGAGDLRDRLGLGDDQFLVVVIGNCKPGQAVDEALQALALSAKDMHIAFVGRGYEPYRERAVSLGVASQAHFVGAVPAPTIVPFVRGADAAALLYFDHGINWRYALPNGFFQSVAAGLPFLFSPGMLELSRLCARFACGIAVDPRNPVALAEALAQLRAGASHANLTSLTHELSWEAEEARLHEALAGLLAEPVL